MNIRIALGPFAFMSLPVMILAGAFILPLVRAGRKHAAFYWLAAAFGLLVGCMLAVLAVDCLGFWGQAVWLFQDMFGIGALVSLARFAYGYPAHQPGREERWTMRLLLGLLGLAVGIALASNVIFLWDWRQARALAGVRQVYPFLLPLTLVMTAAVFLRRAMQVEAVLSGGQPPGEPRQAWQALLRPHSHAARLLRNFCLAFLAGLVQGIPSALGMAGITHSTMLDSYLICLGLLMMSTLIIVALINAAAEYFSILNRLVGMVLLIALLIFGLGGLGSINDYAGRLLEGQQEQVTFVRTALRAGDLSELPAEVAFVVSAPLDPPGEGETLYRVRYLSPGNATLDTSFFAVEGPGERLTPQAPESYWDWYILQEFGTHREAAHLLYGDYPPGSTHQYISYRFSLGEDVFEVGFEIAALQQDLHGHTLPWVVAVIATSVLILTVCPLFFKSNLIAPLERLLAGVKQANAGNLAIHVPVQHEDEIGFLTRSVNNMVASIAVEMNERQQAEAAQRQLNERLRLLSRQLIQIQEAERRRLSHDLHDETGEMAIVITSFLKSLQPLLPEAASQGQLQDTLRQVQDSLERLRQAAHNLRPPALDSMPLSEALENFCASFAQHSKIVIDFTCLEALPLIPDDVAISIYRLAQEALTNVARHAHAAHAWVTLDFEAGMLSLAVEDDGRGFDPQTLREGGSGIQGLCERFLLLGGEVEIEAAVGRGTRLTGVLPVHPAEEQP